MLKDPRFETKLTLVLRMYRISEPLVGRVASIDTKRLRPVGLSTFRAPGNTSYIPPPATPSVRPVAPTDCTSIKHRVRGMGSQRQAGAAVNPGGTIYIIGQMLDD